MRSWKRPLKNLARKIPLYFILRESKPRFGIFVSSFPMSDEVVQILTRSFLKAQITRYHTTSSTPHGQRLVAHLGFKHPSEVKLEVDTYNFRLGGSAQVASIKITTEFGAEIYYTTISCSKWKYKRLLQGLGLSGARMRPDSAQMLVACETGRVDLLV